MGLDLTVIVAENRDLRYGFTLLTCNRSSLLFDAVKGLTAVPLPAEGISTYFADGDEGEQCYGKVTEDPYGDPLRWVSARDLCSLSHDLVFQGFPGDWKNKAVWADLDCLPPDWPCVLYWS